MINFRYHVVSLTAVFLALAIGLVVGTAALNGPAADALQDNVNSLRKTNQTLRDQVTSLTDQANREEQFVTEAAPIMLDSKLAGRRVVVVTLPSGREHADGVANMLTLAGAKIVGTVSLQDKFMNPDESSQMLELASKSQPPSVPNSLLPTNLDGVETSSALLADVLLGRSPAVTPADIQTVLTAYGKMSYLNFSGAFATTAEAAVIVSGLPATDSQASGKNTAAVTTAAQFGHAGVVTVAGVSAGDGNLVEQIRGDASLAKTISTVDNALTAQGQVATSLALQDQLVNAKVGHYGVGSKATGLMPQNKK